MSNLGIDSLDKLRGRVDMLRQEAKTKFDEIYEWLFRYGKQQPTSKVIRVDIAIKLLKSFAYSLPHIPSFIVFLEENKQNTVINGDQWRMLLAFNKIVSCSFNGYNIDGAWPILIDEYVDYSKRNLKNYPNHTIQSSHSMNDINDELVSSEMEMV
eukprot:TRINITY_DN578_c0_g1_i1.p1 TRINITY_DN578_c0_g1~~TRINITY_DN578_c0_g1_i1.p1  ORF type:complete len:155 (-),score=35.57 TRINITY_DN578_c0_g1_i1:227-691(-)